MNEQVAEDAQIAKGVEAEWNGGQGAQCHFTYYFLLSYILIAEVTDLLLYSRDIPSRPAKAQSTSRHSSGHQPCDQCDQRGANRDYCNVCDSNFCEQCWQQQISHKNHRLAPGSIPHEKTDYFAAMTIKETLEAKVRTVNICVIHPMQCHKLSHKLCFRSKAALSVISCSYIMSINRVSVLKEGLLTLVYYKDDFCRARPPAQE